MAANDADIGRESAPLWVLPELEYVGDGEETVASLVSIPIVFEVGRIVIVVVIVEDFELVVMVVVTGVPVVAEWQNWYISALVSVLSTEGGG